MSDNPTISQPAPLPHPWRPWAWRDVHANWMPDGRIRYWEAERHGTTRPGSPHTSSYVRVRPVFDLLRRKVESVTVAAYRGYWEAASSESVALGEVDAAVLRAVEVLTSGGMTP